MYAHILYVRMVWGTDTEIPSMCTLFFCLNALSEEIGACTIVLLPGSPCQRHFDIMMEEYCDIKEELQLDTLYPPSMLKVHSHHSGLTPP